MNRQSWAALQEHGVTSETDLRLDFFYCPSGQADADSLAGYLQRETDYSVRVQPVGGGFLKKKQWVVLGTTMDTKLTQETLDQWVAWMVAAGFQHGCEFDGWGAQVP